MLEFKDIEVYDLAECIISSGFPMITSWDGCNDRKQVLDDAIKMWEKAVVGYIKYTDDVKNGVDVLGEFGYEIKLIDRDESYFEIRMDDSDDLVYMSSKTFLNGFRYAMSLEEMETLANLDEHDEVVTKETFELIVKDFRRILSLRRASDTSQYVKCHDNWTTGVRVSFNMKYTQYITKQFQRYHWFDYVSSSSLMHRITRMDFSSCCNKYVSRETKDKMKRLIDEYNRFQSENVSEHTFYLDNGEVVEAKTNKDVLYTQYMIIVSEAPMGTELFVRVSTNYKQLQTIYHQRKRHKLKEDWDAFRRMVDDLPLSEYLIK